MTSAFPPTSPAPSPFSAEGLRQRVAATGLPLVVTDQAEPGCHGDYDLNPDATEAEILSLTDRLCPAAVLVPVLDRRPEATLLLTERTAHLPNHGGQVAFPGGKIEPEDATPLDAALREAHEEIGLPFEAVDFLGYLNGYVTVSGFVIRPALAIVSPDFSPQLDTDEVAEIFEVPLRYVMTADNYRQETIFWRGKQRRYYAIPWQGHHIWGATAGILRKMCERLYGP